MSNKRESQILKILYESPTLSNREIGKVIGVARSTVEYYLHKLGIHRNREKQRLCNNTSRSNIIKINQDAEQVILGSILGDGYISKNRHPKNTSLTLNSQLCINHGIKQEEYIKYKKSVLEKNNIKCHLSFVSSNNKKPHYIKGIQVKENGTFVLRTLKNEAFNLYRKLFYTNKKHLSKYLYKLKPLGLAIWYMDDGYYNKGSINICTNSFTHKEVELLQTILKHNFNIETTIYASNLGHPILHIKACSRQSFINIVSPYICNCLKYKIGT